MPKIVNLARMSTSTTGTGTITLGSAVTGRLTFADAGVANGDEVYYTILDGSNSETGIGTYTASGTTLSRDTILASTNSGSAISLSGSAEVMVSMPADAVAPGGSSGQIQYNNASSFYGSYLWQSTNAIEQKNGTAAQTQRVYNTDDGGGNAEWGFQRWSSNVFEVGVSNSGTGTLRSLRIGQISSSYGGIEFLANGVMNLHPTAGTSTSFVSLKSTNGQLTMGNYAVSSGILFNPSQAWIGGGGTVLTLSTSQNYGSSSTITIKAAVPGSNNIDGGHTYVYGQDGSSNPANNRSGGNVYLRGGTGYGTGHDGYIVMDNLPTSDPGVTGALWNNSGVLTVS